MPPPLSSAIGSSPVSQSPFPTMVSSNAATSTLLYATSNVYPMVTRSKTCISKPKAYLATTYPLLNSMDFVPITHLHAPKHAYWRSVMQAKFNALQSTRTWTLVPFTPNQNIVSCELVFMIKKNPDGSIDKYMVWLIAKGFH